MTRGTRLQPDAMRRNSRGQGQADFPAEQPATCSCARLPAADAHQGRARHRVGPPRQGPPLPDRLIRFPRQSRTVLPPQYRMTRSAEFGTTVKRGVRAVQPDIVVHVRRDDSGTDIPGPRIGLVVGKSVGTAVQRHRVARRLRHVAMGMLTELDPHERVVIRALPGSRHAVSARLAQQLRNGLRRSHQLTDARR